MNFTSLRYALLASFFAVGCAEQVATDSDEASSDLVASNPRKLASAPVASEDGRDLYFINNAASNLTDFIKLDVDGGSANRIGSLGLASTISRFERRGHFLFWIGLAGPQHFVGQMEEGQGPKNLILDPSIVVGEANEMVAVKNGLLAFTTQTGGTTTLYVLDAVTNKLNRQVTWPTGQQHTLHESLDGESLLVVNVDRNEVQKIYRTAMGFVIIEDPATAPINRRSVSHFDGNNVLVTETGKLTNIDLTTGVATGLTSTLSGSPVVSGDRVVFQTKAESGERPYVVHSVKRNGSSHLELATLRFSTRAELSRDGSSAMLWSESDGSAGSVATVIQAPLDGSAVAHAVYYNNGRITLVSHDGDALLFQVKYASGTILLPMNDRTGHSITPAKPMYWGSDTADFGLSGDGSTIYAAEDCKLGEAPGVRITRIVDLSGTAEVVPCHFSQGRGTFVSLPNSPNAVHVAADRTSFEILTPEGAR